MLIDIPILESIKDSQTQHGLKYENYRRYRSYCSRRLHRLRRSLNVHQGVASSAKARHQRGRKLMDISNAMVLEAGEKNEDYGMRMILIPLCLAERAWSYAMQLKQETLEHPRRRFHLIRRLEKASEHAQRFEKLCHDPESPCSDRTKEEATAYAAYITGLYKLELYIMGNAKEDPDEAQENLSEAKRNFCSALGIYFKLSLSVKNDDVLEHYRQRVDELRASKRFCDLNLRDQESKNVTRVELPTTLQFHDLAYRHVKQIEQEIILSNTTRLEAEKEAAKAEEVLAESVSKSAMTKDQKEEEDEDEFKETEDGMDEEEEIDEDEESDDDDDVDKKMQGSTVGGVTALFKNFFGR